MCNMLFAKERAGVKHNYKKQSSPRDNLKDAHQMYIFIHMCQIVMVAV